MQLRKSRYFLSYIHQKKLHVLLLVAQLLAELIFL